MFLSGVPFVLFLAACWLYCLIDAALTPARAFHGLSKRTWIVIIGVTFIVGTVAWIISRRPWRVIYWVLTPARHPVFAGYDGNILWYPPRSASTAEAEAAALARHPASRSKNADNPDRAIPLGPDDDPEFLAQLAERIRRAQ
jgi:hypothetical protein